MPTPGAVTVIVGVVTVSAGAVTVTVGSPIAGTAIRLGPPAEIAMFVCVTGPLSPGLEIRIEMLVFDC